MRPALRLADAAPILLDRLAMAGQPTPLWPRPIRLTLAGGRFGVTGLGPRPPAAAASTPSPSGYRDSVGIRDDRVTQLDLGAEDWQEAGFLDRSLCPDHPVQALMVGHTEPDEAEASRLLGQLVGRGRAVEEREVRVAMELGVGIHRGPSMIEHPFDLVKTVGRKSEASEGPKIVSIPAKQNRPVRRLTAVKRTRSSLLAVTLRTGLLVGIAVLLILVLFPAAIAAQAAGLR